MRKVTTILAVSALLLCCPLGQTQEKAPEKTKPTTPVKLTVILTENDGEKKVASLPYSILVNADLAGPGSHAVYSSFTRVGVRVPVPGGGKEGQATFWMSDRTSIAAYRWKKMAGSRCA